MLSCFIEKIYSQNFWKQYLKFFEKEDIIILKRLLEGHEILKKCVCVCVGMCVNVNIYINVCVCKKGLYTYI